MRRPIHAVLVTKGVVPVKDSERTRYLADLRDRLTFLREEEAPLVEKLHYVRLELRRIEDAINRMEGGGKYRPRVGARRPAPRLPFPRSVR